MGGCLGAQFAISSELHKADGTLSMPPIAPPAPFPPASTASVSLTVLFGFRVFRLCCRTVSSECVADPRGNGLWCTKRKKRCGVLLLTFQGLAPNSSQGAAFVYFDCALCVHA